MKLRIALPKGRLWESTILILKNSGIILTYDERDYKPKSNCEYLEFYVVKPRNIPKMVELGMVDVGIIGIDLVKDEKADVHEILDMNTMPVYIVVAGKKLFGNIKTISSKKQIIVATEYTNIAEEYLNTLGIEYSILKTYGSTECFVPEFSDIIIDHTQTGETLKKNNLHIWHMIMKSTTRIITSKNLSKDKIRGVKRFADMIKEGLSKTDITSDNFLTEESFHIVQERGAI